MSRSTCKSLGLETLERKQMLAGDVLVSLMNGHLLVEGDAAANQIAITAGTTENSFIVQGLNGTNVRLASAPSTDPPAPATGLVVEGVRGSVRVDLGDGDDSVSIHDATFRRDLSVNTGAGLDTVRVGMPEDATATATPTAANINVRGSLLIRTGSDNDTVAIGSAHVGGVLAIATYGGDDTVNVGGPATAGAGAAAIGASVPATTTAKFGVDILLGDGTDAATLRDVATRAQLVVGGGAGADAIALQNVTTSLLGLRGGDGDSVDQVTLTGVKAEHAAIELGGGADAASITDSAFNSLAVALGSGNDTLSLQTVKATRALLGGGEGDGDELTDGANNTIRNKVITGFEIPVDVNTPPVFPRNGEGRGPLGGSIARLLGRLRR